MKPPEGKLACYVCKCENFRITFSDMQSEVIIVSDFVSPTQASPPAMFSILCDRCNTLQWTAKDGWYTGQINAYWDETLQMRCWPRYKREAAPRPTKSVEEQLLGMLKGRPELLEKLKESMGGE